MSINFKSMPSYAGMHYILSMAIDLRKNRPSEKLEEQYSLEDLNQILQNGLEEDFDITNSILEDDELEAQQDAEYWEQKEREDWEEIFDIL